MGGGAWGEGVGRRFPHCKCSGQRKVSQKCHSSEGKGTLADGSQRTIIKSHCTTKLTQRVIGSEE